MPTSFYPCNLVAATTSATTQEDVATAWQAVFWLPHLVLAFPPTVGLHAQQSKAETELHLNQHLKANLGTLTSLDPSPLFETLTNAESPQNTPPPFKSKTAIGTVDSSVLSRLEAKKISKAFCKGDITKAFELIKGTSLPSAPLCSNDALRDLMNNMYRKYPPSAQPLRDLLPQPQTWPEGAPELLSPQDILKCINNLSASTSGITGYSDSLLKQLVADGPTTTQALVTIIQAIAKNRIPSTALAFVSSFVLTALAKSNGSSPANRSR